MAVSIGDYIEYRSPWDPTDPDIVKLIEQAEEEVSECFGDLRNKAVALLVMHWKALSERDGNSGSGNAGSVRSAKEGQLAISYGMSGNSSGIHAYYAQTSYGLEYSQLMASELILPRNRCVAGC